MTYSVLKVPLNPNQPTISSNRSDILDPVEQDEYYTSDPFLTAKQSPM